MSSLRIPREDVEPPYGARDPLPIFRLRSDLPGSRRTSGISPSSVVITNTGCRSAVRYFALFPPITSSVDREYGVRFLWTSPLAAISSTSFPPATRNTVGRDGPAARGGAIATLPAGALGGGGGAAAAAGGADGDMIASMTCSDTPLFFSAISASVRVSKFVGLVRIFAMMTRSDSP